MTLPDFLRKWFAARPQEAAAAAAALVSHVSGVWWSGRAACAICGHEWAAVVEIEEGQSEPIVPLECPECLNMAGAPL